MSGSVDDQQSRHIHIHREKIMALLDFCLQLTPGEVGGTNLLGDSPCLSPLYICITDTIQQGGLTSIDMTKDTADGGSYGAFHQLVV